MQNVRKLLPNCHLRFTETWESCLGQSKEPPKLTVTLNKPVLTLLWYLTWPRRPSHPDLLLNITMRLFILSILFIIFRNKIASKQTCPQLSGENIEMTFIFSQRPHVSPAGLFHRSWQGGPERQLYRTFLDLPFHLPAGCPHTKPFPNITNTALTDLVQRFLLTHSRALSNSLAMQQRHAPVWPETNGIQKHDTILHVIVFFSFVSIWLEFNVIIIYIHYILSLQYDDMITLYLRYVNKKYKIPGAMQTSSSWFLTDTVKISRETPHMGSQQIEILSGKRLQITTQRRVLKTKLSIPRSTNDL